MTVLVQVAYVGVLGGIGGGLLVGYRTDNRPAVVNALASLIVALLPAIVERGLAYAAGLEVAFAPVLSLALAVAGLLHVAGMLGWYDTVSWWDHLTHTVSAAIMAAVVYASLHTIEANLAGVDLSWWYIVAFTLLFTMAAGVVWEFLELAAREVGERVGAPPVLEHYGLRDTVLDVAFNALGALGAIALDVRTLGAASEQSAVLAATVLSVTVVGLFGGTLALGLALEAAN